MVISDLILWVNPFSWLCEHPFMSMEKFAEALSLDKWDYVAIVISLIALWVAYKTFKSQKATEKNTMPIINMGIQKKLWLFLIKQFFYKMQYLHILKTLLQRCNYEKKPEESFINSLCIEPDDYLHKELFYDEKYEKYYGNVHWIIKHINDYNLYVSAIAIHLDEKNIKASNIDRMLVLIDAVCLSALKHYRIVFGLQTKEEFRDCLVRELFGKQEEEMKYSSVSFGKILQQGERYTRNDAFTDYFGELDGFKGMYYSITNKYMEFFMVEKKERIVLVDE